METFTETALLTKVREFYKGNLDIYKALKVFELEYGYTPEITEPKNIINQEFIDSQDYHEAVTPEALTYMKELQDSGVVNMFQSVEYIQTALMYTKQEAYALLTVYIEDYTKIYYPENEL